MDLKFDHEVELGLTEGTEVEDPVKMNFEGETEEAGLYLAMARQAQREGYAEAAEVLKRIAWEEAEHASHFAELNGMISESTKENIEEMLKGEQGANKGKKGAADKAEELGLEAAASYFNESSRDEARHAQMLQGILDRYFA
ncbi:rubrerythrin [Halanaerobium saccharolyticum]|uniref:Rubrerythrin n=1 Tax=Halanaerobium saccharolyticum TaxID=43595 RepID=A0A4R6LHX6_9FIRM|nr:ferritin family protein [Halanaerobium saccharolyticum]TDO83502.1 rubrerythrin [Halanaerobium saccharolyticum]